MNVYLNKPIARKDDLVVQEMVDETLVYDLKKHKAHCLNKTAATVWKYCDGSTTITDIAHQMEKEFDCPIDREVILLSLDRLASARLLDTESHQALKRITRRDVLRRVGIGAAIALPLVTSIIAPEAAQAATCKPLDAICAKSSECCSGCCRTVGGVNLCKTGGGQCISG